MLVPDGPVIDSDKVQQMFNILTNGNNTKLRKADYVFEESKTTNVKLANAVLSLNNPPKKYREFAESIKPNTVKKLAYQ